MTSPIYDWVIVGGGIHGVHLALVLLHRGVPRDALCIIDPHARLLARWDLVTAHVGMSHLRSPVVHHLDVAPGALWAFSQSESGRAHARFLPPYQQPSSALFSAHVEQTLREQRLAELHLRARVTRIDLDRSPVRLETTAGERFARNVVLALGGMEHPTWPSWARALKADGARVHHVFDHGIELACLPWPAREVILGGGLSAAQVALARMRPDRRVTMLARHAIRVHQFDADPGWLGPKYLEPFSAEDDLLRRREAIAQGRFRGSMPKEIAAALRSADPQRLELRTAEVLSARRQERTIQLDLSDGTAREADQLLLATGFDSERAGERALAMLQVTTALPLSPCGFPVVDRALRWHPALRVTGPLAELELGPTSRNIAGARSASKRISSSL